MDSQAEQIGSVATTCCWMACSETSYSGNVTILVESLFGLAHLEMNDLNITCTLY